MRIDDLAHAHWPDAARIYAEGLDQGTFEERVPGWEEWDEGHLAAPRLVALADDGDERVLGWAALAPVSRRRGVGRALLAELVRRADEAGIWTIQAGILAGNAASVALHEGCGFRIVGTRERLARKRGAWLDVVLMERRSEIVS
jgi:phosphinothricin acetyltransferase